MILLCNIYKNIEIIKFFIEHYLSRSIDQIIFGVWKGDANPVWPELKAMENDQIIIQQGVMNHIWSGNQADADVHNFFRKKYVNPKDWYAIADLDEFHDVNDFKRLAEAAKGYEYVDSYIVDQVAPGGEIPLHLTDAPLIEQFPISMALTHKVVRGHPKKIVMARQHIPVSSGHHRVRAVYRRYPKNFRTYHFKWYGDMIWTLKERQEIYIYENVRFAAEPIRLLEYIKKHNGKLM